MTPLTWVELDRLADYTAGVLDNGAAAEVAELVRTDARWAHAHRSLVAVEPTVRSQLEVAGQAPERMPDDVFARIDAVLADAPALRRNGLRALPASSPTGSRTARTPRWRTRPMLAGLATTAAAVVAIAGGALVVGQSALDSAPGMTAEDAGGRENPEAQPAPTFAVPGSDNGKETDPPVLLASGTDYQLGTLADLAAVPMATTQTSRAASEAPPDTMAGPLGELSDQDGLQSCLNAIMTTYPGTVTLVDFARFEGQPAVVVVLRDDQGSTVVAAGAECGQSGADELASVRIQ